jgi:hypothetical protein
LSAQPELAPTFLELQQVELIQMVKPKALPMQTAKPKVQLIRTAKPKAQDQTAKPKALQASGLELE